MFESVIAGSLPKPAWLAETQKLWPQWKAQGDELLQAKRDATLLWIKLQEDAGLVTIGQALQYVPKPRLFPCTNCGMAPMNRDIALAKLKALADGAALARTRNV